MEVEDVERRKRRLRKKLLQIENLEILNRPLNQEEEIKVGKKTQIREELQGLLKAAEAEMKRSQNVDSSNTQPKVLRLEEPGGQSSSPPQQTTSFDKQTTSEKHTTATSCQNHSTPVKQTISDVSKQPTSQQQQSTSQQQQCTSQQQQSTSQQQQSTSQQQQSTSQQSTSQQHLTTLKQPTSSPQQLPTRKLLLNQQQPLSLEKSHQQRVRGELRRKWRETKWCVEEMEGHEDLILDCDIEKNLGLVVTASRDTSLKVWDLDTGSQMLSLRGHTGPVTGVRFITWTEGHSGSGDQSSIDGCEDTLSSNIQNGQVVCVSVSTDCSIRIWSLEKGLQISSIYSYNGISKLEVLRSQQCSISGSEGGKLEIYNLNTGTCTTSLLAHQDTVSALSVFEGSERILAASGSTDGIIKVFQVEEKGLRCLYVSENVSSPSLSILHPRPIYSLHIDEHEAIFYGDNGPNLKMLNWKNNQVVKFSNHLAEQGFTDALAGAENLLFATSFDIDSGFGLVNLYLVGGPGVPLYIATLSQHETTRISVLRSVSIEGEIVLITGGKQLQIWKSVQSEERKSKSKDVSSSIQGCVLSLRPEAVDSETDLENSEDEEADMSRDEAEAPMGDEGRIASGISKPGSGFCNCTLM